MSKRMSVDELQWFAFVHAETDLDGLVEAYAHSDQAQKDIYEDRLNQLRAYRKKRWGNTSFETATKDAPSVSIYTLMNAPDREFKP